MQTVQSLSGKAGDNAACRAVPHEIRVEERFDIVASDGVRLAATLHAPLGEAKAAVQIHAGMGVKRQFYRHFAAYLASHGYAVLSFDVRGLGESLHGPLPRCEASVGDWTRKDMPAALDWLARHYPNVPRFAVGHSFGGQITGLMPNHHLLDGLVLVFAPKGDLYALSPKGQLAGLLIMGLYMPLTLSLFGYAPMSFLMTAQDLPAGAGWDWVRLMFHRGWIKGDCADRGEAQYYDQIEVPTLALALDKDMYAPPHACARLLREYYRGPSELVLLRAADSEHPRLLDHLGYFRRQFAESHWSQVTIWLDRQVDALTEGVRVPHALSA